MKTSTILSLIILLISIPLLAQDNYHLYIGAGPTYSIPNGNFTELKTGKDDSLNLDYKDSFGGNVQFGVKFKEYFSFGINLDYSPDFELENNTEIKLPLYIQKYYSGSLESKVKVFTAIPNFRISTNYDKINPFAQIGLGYMHVKKEASIDISEKYYNIEIYDSASKTSEGICALYGLGIELSSHPNIAFDIGCNYVHGIGDSEIDKIRYFNLFMIFRYYF